MAIKTTVTQYYFIAILVVLAYILGFYTAVVRMRRGVKSSFIKPSQISQPAIDLQTATYNADDLVQAPLKGIQEVRQDNSTTPLIQTNESHGNILVNSGVQAASTALAPSLPPVQSFMPPAIREAPAQSVTPENAVAPEQIIAAPEQNGVPPETLVESITAPQQNVAAPEAPAQIFTLPEQNADSANAVDAQQATSPSLDVIATSEVKPLPLDTTNILLRAQNPAERQALHAAECPRLAPEDASFTMSKPECSAPPYNMDVNFLSDGGGKLKTCVDNKWIVLMGDSQMRRLFMATHLKMNNNIGGEYTCNTAVGDCRLLPEEEGQYTSYDLYSNQFKSQISFRFAPMLELNSVDVGKRWGWDWAGGHRAKMTLENPNMHYDNRNTRSALSPVPESMRKEAPDVLVMSMGLWDLMGIDSADVFAENWKSMWLPHFEKGVREMIAYAKERMPNTRMMWMTTSNVKWNALGPNHQNFYGHNHLPQLNSISLQVAKEMGLSIFDMYGSLESVQNQVLESDGFHVDWNKPGGHSYWQTVWSSLCNEVAKGPLAK